MKELNKAFTEFKKNPTVANFDNLVSLLRTFIKPGLEGKEKASKNDEEARWHEFFAKAKLNKRHEKACQMIADNLSSVGIICEGLIPQKGGITTFVVYWEKHKEDGPAGLYLTHSQNKWEIASLDPSKELKGQWESPYSFDEMMGFNCDWDDAYPE